MVLVILGLLTGGILAGQALVRNAELRAGMREYEVYAVAIKSFRDKYFEVPGDMMNATRFWGRMNSGSDCVSNSSAALASNGACDGNGDGLLGGASAANRPGEIAQFWRHLAAAGLIEGRYSGTAGTASGTHCVIGTDCPKSRMRNAGWGAWTLGNYPGDSAIYAMDYGNVLTLGAQSVNAYPLSYALTTSEAWNIDSKFDDGKPASGKIIARYWDYGCSAPDSGTNANSNLAASYRLSVTTEQCSLYFRHAF